MTTDGYMAQLALLIEPPLNVAPVESTWIEAEARLGVVFAETYRTFIDTYGRGLVGGELHVVDPRSGRFDALADVYLEAMADLEPKDAGLLPPFPSGGDRSLLPCASNGKGDAVFLLVDNGVASDDTLFIGNIRDQVWTEQPGPFARLLLDLFTGASPLPRQMGARAWTLSPVFQPS